METENLNIPDIEKENLVLLTGLMERAAKDLNEEVSLEVVGGTSDKEWPRKDIDVLCRIKGIKEKLTGTELEKANKELKKIIEITERALYNSDRFMIKQILMPYIVAQFNDPNILEFGGTIKIKPKEGTEIEIIKP